MTDGRVGKWFWRCRRDAYTQTWFWIKYPLYTALLWDSRWIGNPKNHSSTTVSVSPSCLSAHFFNHMRFSESN